MRAAADQRELLPDRRRRVGVWRLPGGALPPPQEANFDAAPGGDPRRRPTQVLRAARQGLSRRAPRLHQDTRALHVLALLHRLLGARAAALQAGGVPAQPLRRPRGGGAQAPLPDTAARRGARVDRLPHGPRAAADAGAHRGAGVPRAVRGARAPRRRRASPTRARLLLRAGRARARLLRVRRLRRLPRLLLPGLRLARLLHVILGSRPASPVPYLSAQRDSPLTVSYSSFTR